MKNILLLTDFSDNAWNAMFTALKLHESIPCRFFLLNTYEPAFAPVLGEKSKERLGVLYDSLSENSNIELKKIMDYLELNHENPDHCFEMISMAEDIVKGTKKVLSQKEIDLVVMGSKGASGAKEVFMGSNAVKVIKKIRNRPILVVPDEHDFKRLTKIVFPTDFSRTFNKYELKPLREIAEVWNARVLVLQVAQEFRYDKDQEINRELLKKHLHGIPVEFCEASLESTVEDAIMKFSASFDAEMIALIHYEHTFMEKLTHEPVIKKMGFHTPVPLLVLPDL